MQNPFCQNDLWWRRTHQKTYAAKTIGNLGGYFGPSIFGILKYKMHNDFYGVLFLAAMPAIAVVVILNFGA